MKPNGKSITLTSYDDIFKDEETRQAERQERVQMIAIDRMDPFPNHPFKIVNDEKMRDTVESIKENGVLVPTIVRPKPEGRYEIVAGHRRRYACELAGIAEIPAIVREMSDDEAVIIMVDSNLQRETLLPSEKAFAYKMKLEALNRRAGRPLKNNCGQVVPNYFGVKSTEIIGEQTGESGKQIQRYIRLTELSPDLLEMVDEKNMSFNAGVEVSYLKPEEQSQLYEVMEYEECSPSLSQAQRLKKCSQENRLTKEVIAEIMREEKDIEMKLTLGGSKIKKYFPKDYTPKQMEQIILKLLDNWSRKRQREEMEK
ncbi:MAG: ParB/RepB/Spo0J family partition protein [Firmicutes bacterium]|nr:ParB/RepB/Spo0J family partition protein [Bacillota bacterium]